MITNSIVFEIKRPKEEYKARIEQTQTSKEKKVGPGAINELASSDDRLYPQWILNIPILHTYLYLLYILIIRILKNP